MSNRAVSSTYRTVIDDVIGNVRQDFEDMGIEREVLEELQRSWEAKIVATGVADFDGAAPANPPKRSGANGKKATALAESAAESSANGARVKKEEDDGKLSAAPKAEAEGSSRKLARTEGSTDVSEATSSKGEADAKADKPGNGEAEGEDDDSKGKKRKRPISDTNEIGSDLDDSDDDDEDGTDFVGNEDLILCLYDKVQRVRNKWKCVLKDGVASIEGRDYVFSKLASEMEW